MKKKSTKRRRTPEVIYVLFDKENEFSGAYETMREAQDDAWGPRFRPCSVRVYKRFDEKKAWTGPI